MKNIYLLLFIVLGMLACNSPEQNSATGNSEDSLTIKSDSSVTNDSKMNNSDSLARGRIFTDSSASHNSDTPGYPVNRK